MSDAQAFPDVRRAATDDLARLEALWLALQREQAAQDERLTLSEDAAERWRNDAPYWLSDETQRLFVAEDEGTVVGFVSARRTGPPPIYAAVDEVFIDELYVVPAVRSQGIGRQLVAAVTHWATHQGVARVRLQVLQANGAGQAFWKAQGATPYAQTFTLPLETRASGDAEDARKGSAKIGF
ncbi:GNAT family N-acetyltransferase [Salisaeta longa]|uniref:GNAT family N-acetyltransferase n=1 Tax=Salisaeta longa TaxID=503170 RepID=UPI00048B17CA|nr:GNAT family N-acetyltransferase [Salisaeta longa]